MRQCHIIVDQGSTMSKILIIDDSPELLETYKDGLTHAEFEVETAPNGEEGIDKALTSKPDLILLDVMMPVMNGFDVLKQLKALPETKNIPVIILTNLAEDTEEHTAKDMGAADYLVKNEYDPGTLAKTLHKMLDKTDKQ